MIKTLVLLLLLTLNGCAVWDWIKPTGSGLSVDTEIVAGDKAINTEVTGKKEATHNTADTINSISQTVNEEASWWMILLLIAGWVLPSPRQIWMYLKHR